MPRYRFNLKNGWLVEDRKGTVLPDPDAAREHAAELARNLVARVGHSNRDWSSVLVVVTDDSGSDVLAAPICELNNGVEGTAR